MKHANINSASISCFLANCTWMKPSDMGRFGYDRMYCSLVFWQFKTLYCTLSVYSFQGNIQPETESPNQLFPVGEEGGPDWNRPLLNSPDKYEFLQSPSVNKYSSFDPLHDDSLLWRSMCVIDYANCVY